MSTKSSARRNLALYPWYVGGVACYAWMPVFFLYFASRVSLSEVLALEAIYYAGVVVLEVPSGYFSDRVGRRATLMIAALSLAVAYVTFALSATFWGLALAQILLAAGLAFNSGTDTSFHLASLVAAGRDDEYARREARLTGLVFVVGAAAALAGGGLGVLDLRLAYVVSGVGALVALGAAAGSRPIAESSGDQVPPDGFTDALRSCVRLLRGRLLGWLFAVSVVATVINHIPYELYQPYLEQLDSVPWPTETTPLVAGVHAALVMLVAAPTASVSDRLAARLGLVWHLLLSLLLQVALISLMALFVHPLIAVLLLARSMPRALQSAPMRAAIAPRVPASIRATYLSLQSLAGRLGFSLLLAGLSLATADELGALLALCTLVAVSLVAVVGTAALLLRPTASDSGIWG